MDGPESCTVLLKVPWELAVFEFEPDSAVTGPTTQVCTSNNGRSAQAHPERSTPRSVSVGSVTLPLVSGTSPIFSTVI